MAEKARDIVRVHQLRPVCAFVKRVGVDVLEYALLPGLADGGGVEGGVEMESLDGLDISEIQGVCQGDDGEGAAAGGEAIDIVPDGAQNDSGVREAGKAVRHPHLHFVYGDFSGENLVLGVYGYEVSPDKSVCLNTGNAADEGHACKDVSE